MELETQRLILRTPTIEDVPALQLIASDPRVALRTGSVPHPYPIDGAERFIEEVRDKTETQRLRLAITLRGSSRLVGLVGRHLLRAGQAEITYMLSPEFWDQGIATEAVKRVVEHSLIDPRVETIVASALASNLASQRVFEKVGFSRLYERPVELPVRGGTFPVAFWMLRKDV